MMGAAAGPAQGPRVCRLRGLPYSATQEDICRFFEGYTLEVVYLCKRDGRSTGEAYVVFKSPLQASGALDALNNKYMGHRYIELFEAAEADLAAVKHVLEDTRLQGCVVRLRGLPYTATAADIAQFFEGVRLAEGDDAIVFTQAIDGRPTGEAYVELADQDAHTAAMMRHKEVMGSRYIEVFHSSKVDKLQASQQKMCMPRAGFGSSSWNRQMLQPDMVATAAAAGMHVMPGAMMPPIKPLGYAVDQLADSLQGAHLTSSLPMALSANPMQQQFRLPPGAFLLQPITPQILLQQHQQQFATTAAGPSSTSSLPASTLSMSSASSSLMSATCVPMMTPVSSSTAVMQPQQPALSSQQQQQQQQLNQQQVLGPVGMPPVPQPIPGPPQMIVSPDGQPKGPAVFYPVPIMQQGMVAAAYAVPAYTVRAPSVPPGPTEPPMMISGSTRPVLFGGGQWVPHPPWA